MGPRPIVAGIILAAAALEEIALHPTDGLALAFRLMLAGGLMLVRGGHCRRHLAGVPEASP